MQLYRPRHKTAHRALQALFLRFVPFYSRRYQTGKSEYNAVCATLERITAPQRLQRIPEIPAPRRTLYRSAQPPIIIRYIRVQGCACYGSMPDGATHRRPYRPGGVSVSTCTGSARHPPPGGAIQQQGRGGRRGTIDGCRRIYFRAFAR